MTHSSVLAWAVPWTEEHGGLQSVVAESDMTEHAHIVTKGFNSRFLASSGYIICQDRRGCRSERKYLSNKFRDVSLE